MNDNTGVIYVITNIVNHKQYVGQAVSYSGNRPWGSWRRWQSHVRSARNNKCVCRLLENAIRKYGEDQFTVEDVLECGIFELNHFEQQYIKEYQTLVPNGYNLMTGGGNGKVHSDETKARMSIIRTGKKHTEITKQRIGEGNRKPKRFSKKSEWQQNISKSCKYQNMSNTNRERLKEALDEIGIEHLPMYVCLCVDRRYDRNVDIIKVRHPDYPVKKFGKKNMSLADKIRLAISYTQRSSV